jgi:hypothetical protein
MFFAELGCLKGAGFAIQFFAGARGAEGHKVSQIC